jgi:hypothetical protein
VTDFVEMVTPVPVAPVFATAKLNFLLIVTPSAEIGIVASQAADKVPVKVKVIVGVAVPLFVIDALTPEGFVIVPIVTAWHDVDPQNIYACVVQVAPLAAPLVPPTKVNASLVSPAEYPSLISNTVI